MRLTRKEKDFLIERIEGMTLDADEEGREFLFRIMDKLE